MQCLIYLSLLPYVVYCSLAERNLYKMLLANYSTLVRPVPDPSLPLTVYIKVHLQQIIKLEMKDQIMDLNAYIRYEWNDYRLRWNSEEYGNISAVRFNGGEESQIWMPDIILWNSCDDEHFDSRYTVNAVVYKDGTVNYIPPGVFKIACKVDITWFPFDEQTCYMLFSSWTYHKGAMDLQLGSSTDQSLPFDVSSFVNNGQWHLVDAPAYRREKVYSCCPEVYPSVLFVVHLRRRTLYYIFNVLIPSVTITLMTLLTFILPPTDMSEKIGHQTTVVLSVSFFLTVIADMTPPTSESVPLLGVFFTTLTCIVSSSAAFTITVLNIRYRQPGNHIISHTFQKLFYELLPYLMCMKRPGYHYVKGKAVRIKKDFVVCVKCSDDAASTIPCNGNGQNLLSSLNRIPTSQLCLERKVGQGFSNREKRSIKFIQSEKYVNRVMKESRGIEDEGVKAALSALEALKSTHHKVNYLLEMARKKRRRHNIQEQWKFAAMAFDRFLLIIFTAQLTICIIGLVYFAPYFEG